MADFLMGDSVSLLSEENAASLSVASPNMETGKSSLSHVCHVIRKKQRISATSFNTVSIFKISVWYWGIVV